MKESFIQYLQSRRLSDKKPTPDDIMEAAKILSWKETDKDKRTPMMFLIGGNSYYSFGLSKEQMFKLFMMEDLRAKDSHQLTAIMHLVQKNKSGNNGFTREEILQILYKSDLKAKDEDGFDIFYYLANFNKEQKLNLTKQDLLKVAFDCGHYGVSTNKDGQLMLVDLLRLNAKYDFFGVHEFDVLFKINTNMEELKKIHIESFYNKKTKLEIENETSMFERYIIGLYQKETDNNLKQPQKIKLL